MNLKELKELVEFLVEKDIAEFEMERGDLKVRVRRPSDSAAPAPPAQVIQIPAAPVLQHIPQVATSAVAAVPAAPAPAAAAPTAGDAGLHTMKSPIVGTFYDAPSPGSPPFVKIGDAVEAGQVLCIVEAMKLMNEIESDVAGEVVKKFATNGQPVEYGQALFAIRPR
ncbi:MAG: acetyl-CoA carboxylase biotin carboxyl carrier protein [Acidobacteriales bacterium]|nr:acetyl-CoA carboxylase biotin carboxyl carrier protein [Terriglobales bacterium]